MRVKVLLVLAMLLVWATTAAGPAWAEWMVDFYLGTATTQSNDFTLKGPGTNVTFKNVDFDTTVSFGGRAGYWFEGLPVLGAGVDFYYFRADMGDQTVSASGPTPTGPLAEPAFKLVDTELGVASISFDLMLRAPFLASREYPRGQLQAYLTAGPTLFVARLDDPSNFSGSTSESATDTSWGIKVGAGLAWQFQRISALFVEYRFTHFSPEFEFSVSGQRLKLETDVNTHSVVYGISFRFP